MIENIDFWPFSAFSPIYCHLPQYYHRIRNALYKGISRDVWQSGSKFEKIKFINEATVFSSPIYPLGHKKPGTVWPFLFSNFSFFFCWSNQFTNKICIFAGKYRKTCSHLWLMKEPQRRCRYDFRWQTIASAIYSETRGTSEISWSSARISQPMPVR